MLYFIYSSYTPNNASCNRMLAYLRSMSQLGVNVKLIFLIPDQDNNRISEKLEGIDIEYCWDHNYIPVRFFKNISYLGYLLTIFNRIRINDTVYVYGDIDILSIALLKRCAHVFYEITEHPLVHPRVGRICRPTNNMFLKMVRRVDGLFVISTCLRDYFINKGVDANKISIINSIVDTTRFNNVCKQSVEPYFAYCGNGNNLKDRIDDLIIAFSRIASRHVNIKLYIIGPEVVKSSRIENRNLVRQFGLEERIVFLGSKPASEIPQLLKNAKALFLTRPDTLQNRAGFSTKLSEYLCSGVPVVVSNVGDISLFLKNRENAYLYTPGKLDELEMCLWDILDNPDKAEMVGINGRNVAMTSFNAILETKKLIKAMHI